MAALGEFSMAVDSEGSRSALEPKCAGIYADLAGFGHSWRRVPETTSDTDAKANVSGVFAVSAKTPDTFTARALHEPTYRATASRARSLTDRPSFFARFCAAR